MAFQMFDKQLMLELSTSGASVMAAASCTNPIDVVKVRQQLRGLKLNDGTPVPGLVKTGVELVQKEGAFALTKGMGVSLARGLIYGGIRIGFYGPMKTVFDADANNSTVRKILAGASSGAIAAGVTNPTDLIKTRLQAKGGAGKSPAVVIKEVMQQEGVVGLWKGTMPSVTRASVLTASQCATYDEVKRALIKNLGWGDGFPTHLTASMLTGLVSTTATAPVDVIKTHMFVGGGAFSGPIDCMLHLMRQEGARALFKGWTANYVRLGPQTTITFLVLERLREWAGLHKV